MPDSTLEFKIKKFTYERVPLKRIREISYKNRWLGIPAGFLAGSTLGLYFGFVVGNAMYNKSQSGNDKAAYYFILGTPVGALIGSIIGWLVGYNYTYRFNP